MIPSDKTTATKDVASRKLLWKFRKKIPGREVNKLATNVMKNPRRALANEA